MWTRVDIFRWKIATLPLLQSATRRLFHQFSFGIMRVSLSSTNFNELTSKLQISLIIEVYSFFSKAKMMNINDNWVEIVHRHFNCLEYISPNNFNLMKWLWAITTYRDSSFDLFVNPFTLKLSAKIKIMKMIKKTMIKNDVKMSEFPKSKMIWLASKCNRIQIPTG